MAEFNATTALLGGILLGISTTILLLLNGRLLGISGIFRGVLTTNLGEAGWRWIFLIGLLAGGAIYEYGVAESATPTFSAPVLALLGGLLVGFGTHMGNGCTSGHGVCGLARLSPRSIVATITFVATGAITIYVLRHLLMVGI